MLGSVSMIGDWKLNDKLDQITDPLFHTKWETFIKTAIRPHVD
jgi:hypothetical protein